MVSIYTQIELNRSSVVLFNFDLKPIILWKYQLKKRMDKFVHLVHF